ncbi:hypothetical protein ACJMK2_031685 [Sinanodonta woodiana]|uniref:Uncharacterized protein n=1 Tax=Sinanodonta woodiana TaxID=1069815 RepID=A0ABD3X034_SINWO
MISCLIWNQRSNRYNLKAVQRLVLATSSSTLNSAPSAIRNQLPTAIVDEEGLCRLIRSTSFGNVQSVLKYRSNPNYSPSCGAQSTFAMSVPILEDDEPGLACKNMVASKESNTISIQTPSYTRDNNMCGLLEGCPTACISSSAARNAAVDPSQPDQLPNYPYAKVKNGSRSTFTNNNQFAIYSVPGGEFTDGYKMVNFALRNEPRNTFQNMKIVSESTIPLNNSLQEEDNIGNNNARDAMYDDGYEICGNTKHMSYMEHTKVSEDEGAKRGKDQEPKNYMIPRCAMHSDSADIKI